MGLHVHCVSYSQADKEECTLHPKEIQRMRYAFTHTHTVWNTHKLESVTTSQGHVTHPVILCTVYCYHSNQDVGAHCNDICSQS